MTVWLGTMAICCGMLALLSSRLSIRPRIALAACLMISGVCLLTLQTTPDAWDGFGESIAVTKRTVTGPVLQQRRGEWVSSVACRRCHTAAHASWHKSYHRTMTQAAAPETVVGDFDRVTLDSRGREYVLSRQGQEFWVELVDPDWETALLGQGRLPIAVPNPPRVDRRIVMTTGSHHMQGYWIRSRQGNVLRQVPWYYLIEEQRWIPREDAFLDDPAGPRHFKIWNDNCIFCHSVAGNPQWDDNSGQPSASVVELGIACESCHGPGAAHIRWHEASRKSGTPGPDGDPIVNPQRLNHRLSSQVCGQCHSFWEHTDYDKSLANGLRYRAGDRLESSRDVVEFRDRKHPRWGQGPQSVYWDDGTCRVGGDEYNAMVASACFLEGKLSCLSCHSMHDSDPDQQLAEGMRGNRACVQCHSEFGQTDVLTAHTHHEIDSSGSRCYNCHMPRTTYALLRAMRSHRIDIPRVDLSLSTGRPNACNLCHLDQSLNWTAGWMQTWYAWPIPEMRADDRELSAAVTWALSGNGIQRAVAAWAMGWEPALQASGRDWPAPILAELLLDPYSAIRFIAHRSLKKLPGLSNFTFDFVAPPEQRDKDRQRLRAVWSALEKEPGGPLTLQLPDGRIDERLLQRLLRAQDPTIVGVPE